MTQEFKPSRMVAYGPSTRVVQLTTGERVKFAPEALADMVRQARESFIAMNIEHLSLLPPIGRWTDGEIKTLDDGEQQVLLYGERLPHHAAPTDAEDPFLRPSGTLCGRAAPSSLRASVSAEARNFDPLVWREAAEECPLPLDETNKWSDLPPLEWILVVPVVWGATKFLGSFLERLGEAAGDALVAWLKATSRKARAPERERYVTVSFELDDGRQVCGFVPFSAFDDALVDVRAALDSAGALAEVAGSLNDGDAATTYRVAYLFDGNAWRLAWYVTDDGAFRTKYFTENMPDPERFLGRPPVSEMSAHDPGDAPNEPGSAGGRA